MKIAYLSTFYPYRGGIAQFNASLYRAFEQLGHDVKAYTFTRQYPNLLYPGTSQFASADDDTDKIPADRVLDTVNPVSYLSAASKVGKFEPNLLIMKFWLPFFGPSLGTVAGRLRKKGTKVVSIIDNAIPHEKRIGDGPFTDYFLKRNDGFVVMSDAVRDDLLTLKQDAKYIKRPHPLYDHFGAPLTRSEACQRLNIPEDKKVILFFGLIRPYKGLDVLIQAFDSLPEDYYLLIAGDAYDDFGQYEELINNNRNKQRIGAHVRYINDNEVPAFFSAADVSVLPYKSATQSGIVSIAYHFELPVIVTDVGSLREMVEPHDTGLVVDSSSPDAVAASVLNFFRSGESDKYRGNIKSFKATYSWSSLAETIVSFYGQLSAN